MTKSADKSHGGTQEHDELKRKKKVVESAPEKLKAYSGEPNVLAAVAGNLMLAASMDEQAALLGDDRFSHPANSSQLAGLVTQLQRTYGNAYVQRLLDSKALQAKLTVNPPHDEYEREADRVAEAVTQAQVSPVQRQEEEEELQMKVSGVQRQGIPEEEEIQAKRDDGQPTSVSAELEGRIDAARGTGQPLADSARATLEPYLGHDLSQVRIHTDAEADKISRQLEAEAFTTGRDVFFKQGAYQPESETGKELLAHELTHVVQQSREPALQRQEAAVPAAEAPALEFEELEVTPRSALEILMTDVVIPITRAHTILGAGGPVRDRAREAIDFLVGADPAVLVLERRYRESNAPLSLRLMHFHGILERAMNSLLPHAGVEIPLETIREWIDPSGELEVAGHLIAMLPQL
jgi:hypothetical protein